MKKIILSLCLFALTIGLFAQHRNSENLLKKLQWDDEKLSILVDSRLDLESIFNKDSLENLSFKSNDLKLWLVGDITPKIHYQLRQNLSKSFSSGRDGYAKATEQAWISFDISNSWVIKAGRQSINFGTFEYDYNGADIYLSTMVNSDIDNHTTGVNVAYTTIGQTFNLQVVNSDEPQFANEQYKNKALAAIFLWEGRLFDGKINTRWGYGAFQHSSSKFYSWLTLGTQLNLNKFTAELDYYLGERNIDYGSVVNDTVLGLRLVKDQSLALNLKYNLGIWQPSIKGVWNKRFDKDYDNEAYSSAGVEAVMECYPFKTKLLKGLRFHAAYTYSHMNFKHEFASLSNTNTHTIYLGTRWLFKAK